MTSYDDSGHKRNSDYRGEEPRYRFNHGPEAIKVRLIDWGPKTNLYGLLWDALNATWGERVGNTLDSDLNAEQKEYIERQLDGFHGGHVIEALTFTFAIENISRATTHQLVRTRIGAGGTQHGGRDNDWRHRDFTIPETIWRAMNEETTSTEGTEYADRPYCVEYGVKGPLVQNLPIEKLYRAWGDSVARQTPSSQLRWLLVDHIERGKRLYAAMVDCGIPWQDARRVLPTGDTTYLMWYYSYPSLKGMLANRLEHIMDWEINCVAQLMLREVRRNCPKLLWASLGSRSDRMGKAAFADLDLFPPDEKYPVTQEQHDRLRVLRREQNPFWVLHPWSMDGGQIRWVRTNGLYPHDALKQENLQRSWDTALPQRKEEE